MGGPCPSCYGLIWIHTHIVPNLNGSNGEIQLHLWAWDWTIWTLGRSKQLKNVGLRNQENYNFTLSCQIHKIDFFAKTIKQCCPTKIIKLHFSIRTPKLHFFSQIEFSRPNKKIVFPTKTAKSCFSLQPQNSVFSPKPQNSIFLPKSQNSVFLSKPQNHISCQNWKIMSSRPKPENPFSH